MRYYVVTDDGQKFGPADVQTLNQWIAESRLLPTQMLEEEASGARFAARSVPGLNFPEPAQTYAPGPGVAPGVGGPGGPGGYPGYARPVEDGSRDMTPAWVLFGVGLISCCVVPYISLFIAGVGAYFANRAKQRGHPQGTLCFALNITVIVLAVLYMVLLFALPAVAGSMGIPTRGR